MKIHIIQIMFKTQKTVRIVLTEKTARIEIIRLQNIIGNIIDYIKVIERPAFVVCNKIFPC